MALATGRTKQNKEQSSNNKNEGRIHKKNTNSKKEINRIETGSSEMGAVVIVCISGVVVCCGGDTVS